MEGMLEKGKKEKHEEQVQFASFKQFCDDTTVEKQRSIQEANERIETLKADIQKYSADVAKLTKEIAELDEDISIWNGDIKAATNVREIEKADFDALHKDYSESIDALERAIGVLKKLAHDKKQASFTQLAALQKLTLIPEEAKQKIDLFFQHSDADAELSLDAQPETAGYEFQSHGIIDMLEKLLNKFVDELRAAEEEEGNSKHAFDMLIQDMNAQIEDATSRRDEKAEEKAKTLQAKAEAEGTRQDTIATRDDDQKYLADVTAQCEKKASDFAERQKLRTEEIGVIEQAIEILSSDEVSGAADKHLPGLLQKKAKAAAPSLAQLRSDGRSPNQNKVADYLRVKGSELNSRILSALSVKVLADPFVKVRKMIKDLITRLQEEAAEEASHKEWCDTELSTNEATRKEKTEAVEMLHAEIDELE